MNPRIVAQLNGIMAKFLKEYDNFPFKDNEYAVFELEYQIYYKSIKMHVLPELLRHLKVNPQDNIQKYEKLLHKRYKTLIVQDMNENKKIGSEFLNKLSLDLTQDFNKLLGSYRKMDERLREHFLNQFIKNRQKAIIMLIENDMVLGIKTIANLKCPRLQFYFVNKLPANTLKIIQQYMNQSCEEKVMGLLSEYFTYPYDIKPGEYYAKWEGNSKIHIKFCRLIMDEKYSMAKKFLKSQHKFEQFNEKILNSK